MYPQSPSPVESDSPCASAPAASAADYDLTRLWVARIVLYFIGLPQRKPGKRKRLLALVPEDSLVRPTVPFESAACELDPEAVSGLLGVSSAKSQTDLAQLKRHWRKQALEQMVRLEKRLAGRDWRELSNPILRQNVSQLGMLLGLGSAEETCLLALIEFNTNPRLMQALRVMGTELTIRQVQELIAFVVGLPLSEVEQALGSGSRLVASQLFRIDHRRRQLEDKMDWVSRGFPAQMAAAGFEPMRALRDRIVRAPSPRLRWEQFDHLAARDITLQVVEAALATKKTGVNILLHGGPGVGKTEFVRMLAQRLDCALYEVSTEDEDGDPIEGPRRLQALRVAQGFCARQRSLLVFDEVEDVLPAPHPIFGSALRSAARKGWINRTLENTPCVTFWLTNAPEALDPAMSRRFSLVWEFKGPPRVDRESVLRRLPLPLPPQSIARLAACEHLSPAVIESAAEVVTSIHGSLAEGRAVEVFETIIAEKLKVQGLNPPRAVTGAEVFYDPALINCQHDLLAIAEGIRRVGAARLCLYGPPGSGKSAYGQWLARFLNRPAHVKRASDLLSPYVGQAEKNIAAAFRVAREAGAVLVVDEVDSFLQDRRGAERSWEVTLVNEFLTQLEEYDGVFVATTNLLESTDSAAWRRFDLSAHFDYLRADQAILLLNRYLEAARLPLGSAAAQDRLSRLHNLALGDFGAVCRQSRFQPLGSGEAWVDALEAHCRAKRGPARQITGFSSTSNPQLLRNS